MFTILGLFVNKKIYLKKKLKYMIQPQAMNHHDVQHHRNRQKNINKIFKENERMVRK